MKYECLIKNSQGQCESKSLTFDEIYNEAQPVVCGIIRRKYYGYIAQSDDLTQEVMIDLCGALARYNPDRGTIHDFIYGVAARRISKEVKKINTQRRHSVALSDELAACIPAPAQTNDELAQGYEQLIENTSAKLNAYERKVLELKLDGMSNTAIYNALNPNNQKRRIGHAIYKVLCNIANQAMGGVIVYAT